MNILKKVTTTAALFLFVLAPSAASRGLTADEFYLSLTLTRGEHSRDSHSSTTVITVSQGRIKYDKTYRGRMRGRREPVHREFEISARDVEKLKQVARANGLMKSDALELPTQEGGFYTYFGIDINLKVNGKESLIKLSGPTRVTKIKDESLYKSADALVQEVFNLIGKQDESIVYEKLVN